MQSHCPNMADSGCQCQCQCQCEDGRMRMWMWMRMSQSQSVSQWQRLTVESDSESGEHRIFHSNSCCQWQCWLNECQYQCQCQCQCPWRGRVMYMSVYVWPCSRAGMGWLMGWMGWMGSRSVVRTDAERSSAVRR